MLYLTIILTLFLCFVILFLVLKNKKSNLGFRKRIDLLEKIIVELKSNLEIQNQKVQLSNELKIKMKDSNDILSAKIVAMNMEMFDGLFPKK